MIKAISKPFVSVLKWGTVIITTAVVVISIQVQADKSGDDAKPAVLQAVDLDLSAEPETQASPTQLWAPSSGFADLVEQVSPAVVHVATSGYIQRRNQSQLNPRSRGPRSLEDLFPYLFENRPRQDPYDRGDDAEPEDDDAEKETRPLGIGAGFIISADGYVVTNHHVIDKADEIIVTMTNGDEYKAEIQGSDEKTDVALLKLIDAKDLPFVKWGDDERSRVGDWVLAIGNPFGLGGSASIGIISAIGRDINSGPYDDFIQVDAAINRGNSGGPLFNTQGQVIGINTAIYSPNGGSVGIGFSIPATMAKNVIAQLERSGEVERAWIGVSIQRMDDELADGFGRDNDHGALISSVEPGAPAEKGGIQAGDIILEFDGEPIEEMRDLPRIVAQSPVGEKYKVKIWRDGREKDLRIETERFPDTLAGNTVSPNEEESEPKENEVLGAQLSELGEQERKRYGISDQAQGVLVLSVEGKGLAAKNNLQRGDVIASLNMRSVRTPKQVSDEVSKAIDAGRPAVPILIIRNNSRGFRTFKLK
ncbi:MAG: serine protease Do [Cryomorphaceae bacterium]|jgi:serine protease Do